MEVYRRIISKMGIPKGNGRAILHVFHDVGARDSASRSICLELNI